MEIYARWIALCLTVRHEASGSWGSCDKSQKLLKSFVQLKAFLSFMLIQRFVILSEWLFQLCWQVQCHINTAITILKFFCLSEIHQSGKENISVETFPIDHSAPKSIANIRFLFKSLNWIDSISTGGEINSRFRNNAKRNGGNSNPIEYTKSI